MGDSTWTRSGGDTAAMAGIRFWQGAWSVSTLYIVGDGVYNPDTGSSYVCVQQHTSVAADEPGVGANTATYWELVAKGDSDGFTITYSPTAPASPSDGDYWVDNSAQLNPVVRSADINSVVVLTQAEYDALTPDPEIMYLITA